MDGKGRYQDNILAERLWRTVEYEEVHLKAYADGAIARSELEPTYGSTTTRGPIRPRATAPPTGWPTPATRSSSREPAIAKGSLPIKGLRPQRRWLTSKPRPDYSLNQSRPGWTNVCGDDWYIVPGDRHWYRSVDCWGVGRWRPMSSLISRSEDWKERKVRSTELSTLA